MKLGPSSPGNEFQRSSGLLRQVSIFNHVAKSEIVRLATVAE
jgi:hypothetical protein